MLSGNDNYLSTFETLNELDIEFITNITTTHRSVKNEIQTYDDVDTGEWIKSENGKSDFVDVVKLCLFTYEV